MFSNKRLKVGRDDISYYTCNFIIDYYCQKMYTEVFVTLLSSYDCSIMCLIWPLKKKNELIKELNFVVVVCMCVFMFEEKVSFAVRMLREKKKRKHIHRVLRCASFNHRQC